jgi:hypothetical protein
MEEDEPRRRTAGPAAQAAKLKTLISSTDFWPELAYLSKKLEAICRAIYAVEGNKVTLGDGYYVMLHLGLALQGGVDFEEEPDLYYSSYYEELDMALPGLFQKRKVRACV